MRKKFSPNPSIHACQIIQDRKLHQHFLNDGLFACKKQKDAFLEKLKKGTLFRLTNHLKPEHSIPDKDPFIAWLQQNSTYDSHQSLPERTMGQTFFYLNTEDIQKQKKSIKPALPAIHKQKFSHTRARSPFCPQTNQNHSFIHKKNCLKNATFSSKQRTKPIKTCIQQKLNPLKSKQRLNPVKTHKHHCIQNSLNQTQLFTPQMNHSFDQARANMINSQFYLNDHKKKHGLQTFYVKPKLKLQSDSDFMRAHGLGGRIVNSFQSNLKKLQKQAAISCYDQVSSFFSTMKSQVRQILEQERALKKERKTCDQSSSLKGKQQKLTTRATLNKLKTEQNENNESKNGGYLPKFLLKSLHFPSKRQSLLEQGIFPQKLIRG